MQKWEYHVSYPDTGLAVEQIQRELDLRGGEGWNLVSVLPHASSASNLLTIFVRPKADEQGEFPQAAFD